MRILEKHFAAYHFDLGAKAAYYENLLKEALLLFFIGVKDKRKLPDIDRFLMSCISKLSLVCKVPVMGNLFSKVLKNIYLFMGIE